MLLVPVPRGMQQVLKFMRRVCERFGVAQIERIRVDIQHLRFVAEPLARLVERTEVARNKAAARAGMPVLYIQQQQDDARVAVDVRRIAERLGEYLVCAARRVGGRPLLKGGQSGVRVRLRNAPRNPLAVLHIHIAMVADSAQR